MAMSFYDRWIYGTQFSKIYTIDSHGFKKIIFLTIFATKESTECPKTLKVRHSGCPLWGVAV